MNILEQNIEIDSKHAASYTAIKSQINQDIKHINSDCSKSSNLMGFFSNYDALQNKVEQSEYLVMYASLLEFFFRKRGKALLKKKQVLE